MTTRIPTIPAISTGNAALDGFCTAVKEYIELRDGRRNASAGVRFVTQGDLATATDLVTLGLTYENLVSACTDPIDPPTNFTVVKGHWCNYLSWTNPDDEMFAAIQIWCNNTNDRSNASLLAVIHKPAEQWAHYMEDVTADYYYWIRAVSYNPAIYSVWIPRDSMGGELAPGDETVGETISKIMEVLTGQLTESQLYTDLTTRLDKIETTETAVGALNDRVSQAEVDINANAADILLKASQTEVTQISDDLDAAEVSLAAAELNIQANAGDIADGQAGTWGSISSKVQASTYATDITAEGTGLLDRTALAEEKLWVGTSGNGTPGSPESDTLLAQYTVKLNVNNHIAGVGLSLDESGYSEFMILADKFAVINPENEEQGEKYPFIVGEVDEVSTVGINGNLVVDGTILARHIAADQIDGTHISAASSITLASGGSLTIGNEGSMSIGTGGSISIGEGGSITITGSASGISKFSDANLDNISDGSTWGRVAKTSISSGKIILTSGKGVSGVLPVGNTAAKCTDANADQTSTHTAKDIANLPAATDGAGLYCTTDYLGYYSGSAWMAYIAANGNFLFKGDDDNFISWDGDYLREKVSTLEVTTDGLVIMGDGGGATTYYGGACLGLFHITANTGTLPAAYTAPTSAMQKYPTLLPTHSDNNVRTPNGGVVYFYYYIKRVGLLGFTTPTLYFKLWYHDDECRVAIRNITDSVSTNIHYSASWTHTPAEYTYSLDNEDEFILMIACHGDQSVGFSWSIGE